MTDRPHFPRPRLRHWRCWLHWHKHDRRHDFTGQPLTMSGPPVRFAGTTIVVFKQQCSNCTHVRYATGVDTA